MTTSQTIQLELLAPAKDFEHGVAAINHGADALYIGAPRFGARSGAGNSVEDIARLVKRANIYGVRVYGALNTIVYDNELEDARKLALSLCEAGVDALIVQDMAFAEMALPVALHCSTQTFNMSPDKVKFFEHSGFQRVILERAINIDEIKAIREASNIELEAFVHGAICVCYSGQCSMSQVVSGRSGNRGECHQQCRWDYDLVDSQGKRLLKSKHLLSVSDLNLTQNLQQLVDIGVTSFKIEGRLKDMTYLKNSVSHYRKALDKIILGSNNLEKSSTGEIILDFNPDPNKSFTRGFSTYFLENKQNSVASFNTPKSVGEYIGRVLSVDNKGFTIDTPDKLANGDGISFLSAENVLIGTNVNISSGKRVIPNVMDGITKGTEIYRNYNHNFVKKLENSKTRRAIEVVAEIDISDRQAVLKLTDITGITISKSLLGEFEPAMNPDKMRETIVQQLSKTGDTPFKVKEVIFNCENVLYITISTLNNLRREAVDLLIEKRLKSIKQQPDIIRSASTIYPTTSLSYLDNVANSLSEKFYRDRGVNDIEMAAELSNNHIDRVVMRTRYCIRREIGECLIQKTTKNRNDLHIENGGNRFKLSFDCAKCEMSIIYKGKTR